MASLSLALLNHCCILNNVRLSAHKAHAKCRKTCRPLLHSYICKCNKTKTTEPANHKMKIKLISFVNYVSSYKKSRIFSVYWDEMNENHDEETFKLCKTTNGHNSVIESNQYLLLIFISRLIHFSLFFSYPQLPQTSHTSQLYS